MNYSENPKVSGIIVPGEQNENIYNHQADADRIDRDIQQQRQGHEAHTMKLRWPKRDDVCQGSSCSVLQSPQDTFEIL